MAAGEADYLRGALGYLTGRFAGGPSEVVALGSFKYFPLVGIALGLAGAITTLAATLFLPQPLPVILALGVMSFLSTAKSEAGLAACCDSAAGAGPSGMGAAGSVAIFLVLALKLTALSTIDIVAVMATLVSGQAVARFAHAVRTSSLSATRPLGLALGLMPGFVLLSPLAASYALGASALAAIGLLLWARVSGAPRAAPNAWGLEQAIDAAYALGVAAAIAGPG